MLYRKHLCVCLCKYIRTTYKCIFFKTFVLVSRLTCEGTSNYFSKYTVTLLLYPDFWSWIFLKNFTVLHGFVRFKSNQNSKSTFFFFFWSNEREFQMQLQHLQALLFSTSHFTVGSEKLLLFQPYPLPAPALRGLISMRVSSTTLGNLEMWAKALE